MAGDDIERLINYLSKLPGLGPRSARRAVLHLIRKRALLLTPLSDLMQTVAATARECLNCGNVGTADVCDICTSEKRANGELCVVEDVADLWAMERSGVFKGRYHVLGGTLSALDGVGPEDLRIPQLLQRITGALPLIAQRASSQAAHARGDGSGFEGAARQAARNQLQS